MDKQRVQRIAGRLVKTSIEKDYENLVDLQHEFWDDASRFERKYDIEVNTTGDMEDQEYELEEDGASKAELRDLKKLVKKQHDFWDSASKFEGDHNIELDLSEDLSDYDAGRWN